MFGLAKEVELEAVRDSVARVCERLREAEYRIGVKNRPCVDDPFLVFDRPPEALNKRLTRLERDIDLLLKTLGMTRTFVSAETKIVKRKAKR